MPLYIDFNSHIARIETHNDPALLEKARSIVPKEKIYLSTLKKFREKQKKIYRFKESGDEAVLFETIFLTELLAWFKTEFFEWFNKPKCKNCKIQCEFSNQQRDYYNPAVDVVEVFKCPKCPEKTLFFRYNDTNILLETRTGRCHEHAQCFALFCKVFNYDCRLVFDILKDHIWNEVYSDLQQRWIHCDPSEGVLDKPLMYEVGWKKTLSYLIAIGDTGIQEVTWRYTTDTSRSLITRDRDFDHILTFCTENYQQEIFSSVTPARKKYLLNRLVCELVELLAVMPTISGSYEGRQSGSREWRLQRGEVASHPVHIGHIFEIPILCNLTEKFSIWYSSNTDAYLVRNFNGQDTIKRGWQSSLYSFKNIIRKEEADWKMTYLAREGNTEEGILKWRFMTPSNASIIGIHVLTNFFVCENGKAECRVFSPNNLFLEFNNETSKYWRGDVPSSEELYVEIRLSGGSGENAWQHAQLGRQHQSDGSSVSFGVVIFLQRN